jgi:hypothetical protein
MMASALLVNGFRQRYDGTRHDDEGGTVTDREWHDLVKGILRAEMARRGVTYDQLVAKLAEIGVKGEPKNVRNKVARGGFSAVFLVQCLMAMGANTISIR